MSRRIIFIILVFTLTTGLSQAAEQYFRIARLSYIEGHVSFQNIGDVDWNAASVNTALQPADRLYTGDDGRAEVELDEGSILRLAKGTDVEFLTLGEELIQIRILLGLATLTVRSQVRFEINTPAAAFHARQPGVYRFDVLEDGVTDAIVRKGVLDAENHNLSIRLESGELVHINPGDLGSHLLARYEQRDEWDEWNDRRNADLIARESRQYLPDYVHVGVSDLDRYGRWVVVDTYGPAWIPYNTAAYWSPYWVGRWYYRPYWGWTWISYEPWGWLPYHYGRWHFNVNFGWCWLPGASFEFHFWSPGLVRFYHGNGRVGWYPLGPGDYYNVNHYHYSPTYSYYLNNIRKIQYRGPGDLANRRGPNAFRAVTEENFVNNSLGGTGDRLALARGDSSQLQRNLITDRLRVQPTSLSSSPLPDRTAAHPSTSRSRATVVRTEPSIPTSGRGQFVRLNNTVQPSKTAVANRSDLRSESPVAARPNQSNSPSRAGAVQDTSVILNRATSTAQERPTRESSAIGSSYTPRNEGRVYIIRNPAPNSRSNRSQAGSSNAAGNSSPLVISSPARSRITSTVQQNSSISSTRSSTANRSSVMGSTQRPTTTVLDRGNVREAEGASTRSTKSIAPSSGILNRSSGLPEGKTSSRTATGPSNQTNIGSAGPQVSRTIQSRSYNTSASKPRLSGAGSSNINSRSSAPSRQSISTSKSNTSRSSSGRPGKQ